MKIGLVAAMQCEISGINSRMKGVLRTDINGFVFAQGEISGHKIISVCCGIGLVNAALATKLLIDNFKVDYLVNPGVAGGISEELAVCDVVVSKDSKYWEFSVEPLPKMCPNESQALYKADTYLHEKCLNYCKEEIAPYKLVPGRIVSGNKFVQDLETKTFLREKLQADCVEMEGAAVAHACNLTSTPYLIIRSISDSVMDNDENSLMAFNEFLPLAIVQLTNVVLKLIKSL